MRAFIRHGLWTLKKEKRKVRTDIKPIYILAKARANQLGGKPSAMRDSMLKEFGHFHPEFVRIIAYVAISRYVRRVQCLADLL